VDPDEAALQGMLDAPHMPIGVNGPAIEAQDVLLKEGLEVRPRAELLTEVAAREMGHLRLPVVFRGG
jgi:hypothetical protein